MAAFNWFWKAMGSSSERNNKKSRSIVTDSEGLVEQLSLLDDAELAARARVERGVRGHAREHAPAGRLFDLGEIGGVEKELHPILLIGLLSGSKARTDARRIP